MRNDVIFPPERAVAARAGGFWRDKTLVDDLARNLAEHPDRLAVTAYNSMTGRECRLSTRELDDRARRIATGLLRRGIERGDVVSAQLPNWWEMIALYLAVLRVGAIINPLMPIFRERELGFMLAQAESKLIVAPERFRNCDHASMLQGLQSSLPHLRHVLVIGAKEPNSFERMLENEPAGDEAFADRRATPDDVMEVLYTSGTTGEPKGVMHTSNTLMANLWQHLKLWGLGASDVTLMSSPLAHQTGLQYGVLGPIMTGGRVVLQDVWNPDEAVNLIEREGVTFSIGSTPFLADLLDAAKGRPQALHTLRTFGAAGAPIPRHLVSRAADDFGLKIHSVWGMTEMGAATFTGPDDPPSRALETDGRPAPGMELRIADPNGRPLPHDTEGRLMARGAAGMFVGYMKRPQWYVTDDEGWFDTGDLARIGADGYIRITGRSKDVIIRGGENIPVIEIENLIYQHPAVAEVAIVAMPDPRLNERGCAFVALRRGQALDLAELSQYLLSRQCAKNYLPERLEVVDALPRTASGKIQKFVLREKARAFGSIE
jgi:cyclohexanecarboxylate-CoA ligase